MASADLFNNSTFGNSSTLFGDSDLLDSAINSKQPNNIDLMNGLGNMFGDTFHETTTSNGGSDSISASTVGTLEDSTDAGQEQECKICLNKLNSPRVLSCLHVFCESCIDKTLAEEAASGEIFKENLTIECSICKQTTKVVAPGAASLPCDFISTNIVDLLQIDPGMLACTSCKSKETAISRCNICSNFLCEHCDNAHKHMRCFENHIVVMLEDLRKSAEKVAIHKPLYCNLHSSELLKFYCFNCQVPVCNDCLIAEHKGSEHHCEVIGDAEKRARADIEAQMEEAKTKIVFCDEANNNLHTSLMDLQHKHDDARELINKTYKMFVSYIEDCHETSLKFLEILHSERELKIMDMLHNVEKSVEKIESACKFTSRVLEQANGPELLSLKKLVANQLNYLVSNPPKADINVSLEFETNGAKFKQIITDAFGKFRTESTPSIQKESTPPPTLPGMPPNISGKSIIVGGNMVNGGMQNNCTANSEGALTGSVTASSPISLPTSMQSSFDGDMSGHTNGFLLPPHVMHAETSPSQVMTGSIVPAGNVPSSGDAAPLAGLTTIGQYNLHQLVNLAGNDHSDGIGQSNGNSSGGGGGRGGDSSRNHDNGGNQPNGPQYTLADILAGDHRALQAFATSTYNLNTPELSTNPLIGRGPSPGIDSVSLMNDFVGLPSATSPMGGGSSMNDEMGMSNFSQHSGVVVPGRSKATPTQIRCKFGSLGASKGQFNSPHGFCLGAEEEIIVADTNNHRIEVFEKNGTYKFQFGVPGKDEGQLWYPRKVAVMKANSKFVVCDRGNERSRMQIFTKNGHFIKKIAIRYIDIVAGLAVTNQGHIVAVDSVSPTVFIISEEGDLVHWFDCSDYMREPSDIAIFGTDFYVCDFKGHCVAVFKEDGSFLHRIGNEKVTCFPNGIDISDAGDILIGDSHGNRFHVACFSRDGALQSEFECPYVKVSRCCGLKITSEGYVVTLAKNNHHVLVLNTLYLE